MKRKIYLRADGSSTIGLGHVVRSCALAKMLKDDFECHFVIRNPLPALIREIDKAGAFILQLAEGNTYEEEAVLFSDIVHPDDIVVLDGYNFNTAYQAVIISKGCKLICIDDIHAYPFLAHVIINHAGGISSSDYEAEPDTVFCLGPAYALLREPFLLAAREKMAKVTDIGTMLICMGGADPQNDTLSMLSLALKTSRAKEFYVVVGAAYQHTKQLKEYITTVNRSVYLLQGLDPEEMCDVMRKCDIAICPPSSIALEYLSVGGTLFLHEIADNQKDIGKFFIEKGLAFHITRLGEINNEQMEKAIQLQHIIFDGYSDKRILNLFKKI